LLAGINGKHFLVALFGWQYQFCHIFSTSMLHGI
jgi:hypothetical protein